MQDIPDLWNQNTDLKTFLVRATVAESYPTSQPSGPSAFPSDSSQFVRFSIGVQKGLDRTEPRISSTHSSATKARVN